MLLEMQSAMNNMMNNTQLQSQLHNNQMLPIAKPLAAGAPNPTSEDTGPAPSCSPSSSPLSSQSDSSSDPEPAVSMDTSRSSASPSTSDSSEEEVIGSVTRAHQETFMYNQEQSSLATEASLPSEPLTAGSNKNTNNCTEEQQDAWNHRNNLVTMAANDPPSNFGCQGQAEIPSNHCPFRLSRSTTNTSHCPAYIHGTANGAYSGPLWRAGNRMHLVR